MVVFVDFDEDGIAEQDLAFRQPGPQNLHGPLLDAPFDKQILRGGANRAAIRAKKTEALSGRNGVNATSHPTLKRDGKQRLVDWSAQHGDATPSRFAEALGCYPIVKSLTQWLDLNTLFSLSLTCRQFRANLLQFRSQLVRQTLRCESEDIPLLSELVDNEADATTFLHDIMQTFADRGASTLLAPKIGRCARDLVGECRKCGTILCRNCTVKPPANSLLRTRYRRICRTCLQAPLKCHLIPPRSVSQYSSDESHYSAERRQSGSSCSSFDDSSNIRSHAYGGASEDAFTSSAFLRTQCTCESRGVWLCQPCGQGLRAADITYTRVWTWRSRYSTHIGGLGTGMGEGNEGQKCGRGDQCLAAKDLEVEIDCASEEVVNGTMRRSGHVHSPGLQLASPIIDDNNISPTMMADFTRGVHSDSPFEPLSRISSYEQEPGYFRQEIEGIGGVVKKKVKRRVRVGATVTEYEDERETGKYLEREAKGVNRSWCGWCSRVVPEKAADMFPSDPASRTAAVCALPSPPPSPSPQPTHYL